MEWLKNDKEIYQFLSDMKKKTQVANLDNYIEWIKDQSVQINQNKDSDSLNIEISLSDKQHSILIY